MLGGISGLARLVGRGSRFRTGRGAGRFGNAGASGSQGGGDGKGYHSLFKSPNAGHLRIRKDGTVDCGGGKGALARFELIEVDQPVKAASGAAPRTLVLQIPHGVSAGQELRFRTPEGQEMRTHVPDPIPMDRRVSVQIPPAPAVDQKAGSAAVAGEFKFVCFRSVGNRNNFLQMIQGGQLGGKGVAMASEAIFRIRRGVGPTRIFHPATGLFIQISGRQRLSGVTSQSAATVFNHTLCNHQGMKNFHTAVAKRVLARPLIEAKLSRHELLHFRDHGYVVAKDAVATDLVHDALLEINTALGRGELFANVPGAGGVGNKIVADGTLISQGDGKFSPQTRGSAAILNLFLKSKVWALVESLVGEGAIPPPMHSQIALRFPNKNAKEHLPPRQWHLDGEMNPQFSVLVGICLSPWQVPFCGQFTVFPGQHHRMHADCKKLGIANFVAAYRAEKPALDVKPEQIMAQPGDVVLAHPMLPHRGGVNTSCNIRYAVFFRPRRKTGGRASNEDPLFFEYDGIRALDG
mmetsp:Transcript_5388/g.7170  ORF Transcript_5388/g.7170 Transcript_5388/m.7170 type:complete len:521 (+) Transcript_5388:58-1620(+)